MASFAVLSAGVNTFSSVVLLGLAVKVMLPSTDEAT